MGCGLQKGQKVCATVVPAAYTNEETTPCEVRSSASSKKNSESESETSVVAPMTLFGQPTPVEEDAPPKYFKRDRRVSYSSESSSAAAAAFVSHPKSATERARLERLISESDNFLFSNLSPPKVAMIVNAMFKKVVPTGTEVITQGSNEADNFYILDEGHCDIFVRRNGASEEKVKEITPGMAFGELALLYMCPRAASVRTTVESVFWALARDQFRSLVVSAEKSEKNEYETFLCKVEVLSALNQYERMTLADVLEVDTFDDGEDAIRQGDDADHLFILESGAANAIIEVEGKEPVILKEYRTPGEVFGELALLKESKRNATVRCIEDTTCLRISRRDFELLLGPIHDILRRNAELYTKYADALSGLPNRRYSAVRFVNPGKCAENESVVLDEVAAPNMPIAKRKASVSLQNASTETIKERDFRLRCCARQLLNSYYDASAAEILRQKMDSAYREQFPTETSYDDVSAQKRASRRRTKENIPEIIEEDGREVKHESSVNSDAKQT